MERPYESSSGSDYTPEEITGLGERSFLKSYYPQLQQKVLELERFRTLLDHSADAILLFDSGTGEIVDCNETACRQLSYTRMELVGINFYELVDRSVSDAMRDRMIRTDKAAQNLQIISAMHPRSGDSFMAEITLNQTCLENKNYTIAVGRDISDRIQREKEKENLQEQLRQAQKMEAIGQLAGGVAHDFNNILMAIMGYTRLAMDALPVESVEHKQLEQVELAGRRAASLTRQLLLFSRKQYLELQSINLNALLFDLEKMLRRLIGENIEFVTLAGESLGLIKADPGQIEQIVINLAVNARDAMKHGGKLIIETKNVELEDPYCRQNFQIPAGSYIMLAISDTGCGISPKNQKKIFEPFFTTKEKGKGTGLGLSTVYGIVKQCGGGIFFDSDLGKGTVFSVYFPRVEEEMIIPVENKEQPEKRMARNETVLIVEDEDMVRNLITRVLRGQGYQVLEASYGEDAFRLTGEHAGIIHLLLTDVILPKMGGREVAKRIQEKKPGIKVLFMSGYSDDDMVSQGVMEKGFSFLQKPFSSHVLLRKIREILDDR